MKKIKYIRGNQEWSIEGAPNIKVTFTDNQGFSESPWGAESPDGREYALLNHALAFTPYPSWGAIFTNRSVNFLPIFESENPELTLHPEAYDHYLKEKWIDENGMALETLK